MNKLAELLYRAMDHPEKWRHGPYTSYHIPTDTDWWVGDTHKGFHLHRMAGDSDEKYVFGYWEKRKIWKKMKLLRAQGMTPKQSDEDKIYEHMNKKLLGIEDSKKDDSADMSIMKMYTASPAIAYPTNLELLKQYNDYKMQVAADIQRAKIAMLQNKL